MCVVNCDTHGRVYSHRLSYYDSVRKGGDFFYGKSNYENHVEGVRSSVNRRIRKEHYRDCEEDMIQGERTGPDAHEERGSYHS